MKKNYTKLPISPRKGVTLDFKALGFAIGCSLLILFVYLNTLYSQFFPPQYFAFIAEDREGTVAFLKDIQSVSNYQSILEMQKGIFGSDIEREVNHEAQDRQHSISSLESALGKNPKARDVLYELSLLYQKQGNVEKAVEYLHRAQDVDPMLN
jgi:tetratricopeptide (TPR) repeat protein